MHLLQLDEIIAYIFANKMCVKKVDFDFMLTLIPNKGFYVLKTN